MYRLRRTSAFFKRHALTAHAHRAISPPPMCMIVFKCNARAAQTRWPPAGTVPRYGAALADGSSLNLLHARTHAVASCAPPPSGKLVWAKRASWCGVNSAKNCVPNVQTHTKHTNTQ